MLSRFLLTIQKTTPLIMLNWKIRFIKTIPDPPNTGQVY